MLCCALLHPAVQWEKTRDTRVGTWRDFMTQKSKKSKGGSVALGGLKPPKMKESGEQGRGAEQGTRLGWGGPHCSQGGQLWPARACAAGAVSPRGQ
jgi:hypothetical protein